MGFIPNVFEEHEANPWFERLAPVAVIVGVALVIFFQQFVRMESGATLTTPLPEVQAYEEAKEPSVENLVVSSKQLLKVRYFLHMAHRDDVIPEVLETFQLLEAEAVSRVDRFRIAIIAADFHGAKAGVERLEKLEKEVEPNGALASEVYWMLKRYRQLAKFEEFEQAKKEFEAASKEQTGKSKTALQRPAILKAGVPPVESLSEEMRIALIGRHGFFGSLALVQGPDQDESVRRELLGGYVNLLEFRDVLDTIEWWMGLAGLILLCFFIKRSMEGDQIGLLDPVAPTTVYVEMFAVFALSFGVFTATNVLFLGDRSPFALSVKMILMWSLMLCVIWPRLRGVSWGDMLTDLGLNRGEGVVKEVCIGIAGACTSLFLFNVIELIVNIYLYLTQGPAEARVPEVRPPGMYETAEGITWALLWMSTLGSVIWAPLLEETVFRGALQRWLRVRLSAVFSVLISAAIFGFIHPYSLDGLLIVAIAGLFFGIVREWRQCLIAPIVMHFIHNGFLAVRSLGFYYGLE